MVYERTEEYWYGGGWSDLRHQLVKLCLRHADELLETLGDSAAGGSEIEAACRAWFETVGRAINALLRARPETKRLEYAMSLLINEQDLAAVLTNDRVLRNGGDEEGRHKALVVCLNRHLETQRREAGPGSPTRQKAWERLDRISRKMLPLEAKPGYRCGKEHHQALLKEIKRQHPSDHNLPRNLETLSSYFYEFCKECWRNLPDDDPLNKEDHALLVEATEEKPDLDPCFQELPTELAESLAVVYKIPKLFPGTERFLSVKAYAVQRSLSMRQIYKRKREAEDRLKACLKRQLNGDMVEP